MDKNNKPSDFHKKNQLSGCLNNKEKRCLIEKITSLLTAGVTSVEITESAWCNLLELAVEEYVAEIQKWLINNQWDSLHGKSLSNNDICFALTQRSLDYESSFADAYSKQVGLQAKGNYELKKDFIQIKEGVQAYEVPAGREINRVLWETPSDIDHAIFSSFGYGIGGNYGFGRSGVNYGVGHPSNYHSDIGAYYVAPAYDITLRAGDISLKNRMLRSDLTYKITAGANGTKIIHLLSVPNGSNTIGVRHKLYRKKVWYHYYDTIDMDATEKNKCLESCSDIIKYPSDVPLPETDYCDLNTFSKVWVRKYLTAIAKGALGRARGKFKGKLPMPESEGELDYESYLAESKEDKKDLLKELRDWLDGLSRDKQLEKKANEADNLNRILSKHPNNLWVI